MSRIARSHPARLARLAPRLVFAGVLAASIAIGVVAGCGIDVEGLLVHEGLDASENVGANLPEGSADGSSDGAGSDAGSDGDAALSPSCSDGRCVDAGGGCDPVTKACTFLCDAGSSCAGNITCPPGVPCHVVCGGDDSCAGKVDCSSASACDIACSGARACGGIECAGDTCAVQCNGLESCPDGGISCTAGTCDINCLADGGMSNCAGAVTCKSSVACSVLCDKDGCPGGVTATAPDASIVCGTNACTLGATCFANDCFLGCATGAVCGKLCCDAGICVLDGGANKCP